MFDITVAAAALILFLIVLYSSYKTNELNNHILINQPLVQLDSYLSDMDNLAHSVMTNELLISKFSELREEGDPDNHFAKNILDAIDTSSILNNITGTRSDIFRISVYNDFGDFVYSGAVVNMREADVHMRSLGVGEIMRNFASAEKDYILLEPVLDPWSTIYKSDYLSFIRPIMNIYSRDVVGVVEIQKNTETLISSVYLDVTSDKKINIYNERGEAVLLQPDSDNYNVAAVVTSNLYGWRIDLLENKNDFLSRLVQILLSITLGCVVIIFLVRYLVGRITREIARPLETLKNAVESIDVINPTRIDTAAIDIEEVYSVANSFNTLMENVTFLKEQEKKTHLLALQAQMNPHFLYNVLSIINAAAIEGRAETVLDIVDNLSDMLRYTSAYETGLVKMEDEARYTEQYLKLMKARYA
jgi:HAMP domain-containing protein